MPRVNLLIADDVGLGKTIEAGLVVQELLLRHRARTVLVVCPASLRMKWRPRWPRSSASSSGSSTRSCSASFAASAGITREPVDALPAPDRLDGLAEAAAADGAVRRRSCRPDPTTYPRPFDLLIVDEVHNVAPAGRGKYATDSQRTRAIRDLPPHFEHRLFLSATPHNGYTESFTALLELLDPQRFARGVKPPDQALWEAMVRRLKSELPTRPRRHAPASRRARSPRSRSRTRSDERDGYGDTGPLRQPAEPVDEGRRQTSRSTTS